MTHPSPKRAFRKEGTMSNDSFTEVTNQSWFSRLGNAFKGIVVGIVMVVIAFPLLFLNEGRAVKRYKTLKEGGGAVISVAIDKVDSANQSKLIHLTGKAVTEGTLVDQTFDVSTKAIKLMRVVEMYQWQQESQSEEKKKLGGGTETLQPIHTKKFGLTILLIPGTSKNLMVTRILDKCPTRLKKKLPELLP